MMFMQRKVPGHGNVRMLRDMGRRDSVAAHEMLRRAFKYVARNTTLPFRVRHQAQLQLNQFPSSSRPTAVRNRCIETGRGRGIIDEFGLCRYQFRLKARAGLLPGVTKSSW